MRLFLALFIPVIMLLAAYLPNAVMSPNTNVEVIARVKFTCSGSSSIANQSGTTITNITNVSSGQCTLTIASGLFSIAPSCSISYNANFPTNAITVAVLANNSTTLTTDCKTSADVDCTSYSASIICMGPK